MHTPVPQIVRKTARPRRVGRSATKTTERVLRWKPLSRRSVLKYYKPISDYALIGDQKTCALVGLDGSIDWFCIPRFDSPSVFGALLDIRSGGSFRILPDKKHDKFEATQHYEDLTNILITEFRNELGYLRILDFMPCFNVEHTIISTGEIHRRVSCIKGSFPTEVIVDPRMDYGRNIPRITKIDAAGYSFKSRYAEIRQEMALMTPFDFKAAKNGGISFTHVLNEGEEPLDFVLRIGGAKLHSSKDAFTRVKLDSTRRYWAEWAQRCKVQGKWRQMILRSALILKLLVYAPTGAIIAAATTSLPEGIGGVRNWDYRYSWIRDSSFVLWAFHSIGINDLETGYLGWLTSIFYLMADSIQIMLGVSGERDLSEREIKHLEGYRKSFPVRVGNGAWDQLQLDVFGILLDALYFSHKHGKGIAPEIYDYLIKQIVKTVEENWEKPDCGIWEVRGELKHFVYSKMWCWVAMDRAARIADSLQKMEDAEKFSKLRDRIRQVIFDKGYDETIGSFVRSFGSKELDAANLLMPQVRFIEATDPKMLSTLDLTIKQLNKNGFLYRYKADDGLKGGEGAFLMCSFWLVSCLTLAGRIEEAEKHLDALVKYANHVGLFSEEINPRTGEMLGNFPQAFTHMGFIVAASTLMEALQQRNSQNS